jgi:hypothetical protein
VSEYTFNITPDEESPFWVNYRGVGFTALMDLLNNLLVNGRPVWIPRWNDRLVAVARRSGELEWGIHDVRVTCRLSLKHRRKFGVCWHLEVQLYWAADCSEPERRTESYISRSLLHPANRPVMYAHTRRIKKLVDRLGGPAGWQPALAIWAVNKVGHVILGYALYDDPAAEDGGTPRRYTGFAAIPGLRIIVSRSRYTNDLLNELIKDIIGPKVPRYKITRIRGWLKRVKKYDTLVAGLIREATCVG